MQMQREAALLSVCCRGEQLRAQRSGTENTKATPAISKSPLCSAHDDFTLTRFPHSAVSHALFVKALQHPASAELGNKQLIYCRCYGHKASLPAVMSVIRVEDLNWNKSLFAFKLFINPSGSVALVHFLQIKLYITLTISQLLLLCFR